MYLKHKQLPLTITTGQKLATDKQQWLTTLLSN